MSWKGWLKMAFHQPLVPVLPVARELISKTKWIANKSTGQDIDALASPPKMSRTKMITFGAEEDGAESDRSHSPHNRWRKSRKKMETPPVILPGAPFTNEPETDGSRPPSRNRMFSLFDRRTKMTPSNSGSTTTSDSSKM
jgi:hypothetical protein